jgi:hypothetical protein
VSSQRTLRYPFGMTKKYPRLALRVEVVRHLSTLDLAHVHAAAAPRPGLVDTHAGDGCTTLAKGLDSHAGNTYVTLA